MSKARAAGALVAVTVRRFGPCRWLAINCGKDPAMWCYFGEGAFGGEVKSWLAARQGQAVADLLSGCEQPVFLKRQRCYHG